MIIWVTGIGGLVGSAVALAAKKSGHGVAGVESNHRARFFGEGGDVSWRVKQLREAGVTVLEGDFRGGYLSMVSAADMVVHAAAQPSHDYSRENPQEDAAVNFTGTHQLLEACRKLNPGVRFVYLSTNKVYGDRINNLKYVETPTRLMPFVGAMPDGLTGQGVTEEWPVDQCWHTPFGVSKLAADLMTQEYRHSYGMTTVCFRCGCMTGVGGSPVELQGFLGWLVRCAVRGEAYTVYGYDGKQVRCNIDAGDVAGAILEWAAEPRPGVYNMGGGIAGSVSILEAADYLQRRHGLNLRMGQGPGRPADFKWMVMNTEKFQADYPAWKCKGIWEVIDALVEGERGRREAEAGDAALPAGADGQARVQQLAGGAPAQRPGPGDARD